MPPPEATITDRTIVLFAYLAIALALYWPALGAPLVSDDYYFLGIVAPASSPLVVFEPLLDRFWRPVVAAMYYVSYHGWGLWPWPYHLFALLAHVASAWLLYLCVERIEPDQPWMAKGTGLLFLVFGGHSEAVAFPGGFGDPVVTAAILAALYCCLRLDIAEGSGKWGAGLFIAVAAAAMSKETWVVLPAILAARAVPLGVPSLARRRAVAAIAAVGLCVVAYLAARRLYFGSVAGDYSVLSQSFTEGTWRPQVRAFVLRCFAPSGHHVANLWLSGRDVLIWPAALIVLGVAARGRTLRMLLFAGAAMAASLVPVLPLSISVSNTESERYVYLATAFSSIVVMWGLRAVLRRPPLIVVAALLICAGHAVALVGFNRQWRDAGEFTRRILHGIADRAREHADDAGGGVFVLNLPDNITGPFILRVGLYPALALNRPDLVAPVTAVATVSMAGSADEARVERTGLRAFRVDLGRNRIVQRELVSTFHYTFEDAHASGYTMTFNEGISRALVLYVSGGVVEVAGTVAGAGLPFGFVDLPADGTACQGESIRFAGWALDADGLPRVRLVAPAPGLELGAGAPRKGMRPDVAAQFATYPDVDRAGWDFELPCRVVEPFGSLRVQAIAEGPEGRRQVIGERTVTTR